MDKNIAQPGKSGVIADHACQANLAGTIIQSEGERVLEIAGNHLKRFFKKGQGEIRIKLSTQGVGLYKIVMMAPEQYSSKVVTIKKRKALFKKGKEPLFMVADKAALRIYFRGNSLQEDNVLSELAGEFDFKKLEKLLVK